MTYYSGFSFKRSLDIQFRVIGALLMREVITRYGRHNIGFLWLFLEPMIFTGGVATLWTLLGQSHGADLPVAAFALTGYSCVLLFRNMPNRCSSAIGPNLALMYHRNVKPIYIYLARILLEIAGTTASFFVLGCIFTAIGMTEPPDDILKIMCGWLMIAWFGSGLALLIGALSERSELVEKIWHPISYLIFPLSGVAFMVHWLPLASQKYIILMPTIHGIELLREGYFGPSIHAQYDMSYMAIVNLCLTFLGLYQVRVISKTVMSQ